MSESPNGSSTQLMKHFVKVSIYNITCEVCRGDDIHTLPKAEFQSGGCWERPRVREETKIPDQEVLLNLQHFRNISTYPVLRLESEFCLLTNFDEVEE